MEKFTSLVKSFTGQKNLKAINRIMQRSILALFVLLTCNINAATYYLTAAGASNAEIAANWNTIAAGGGTAATNFTTNGDIFNIPIGITGTVAAAWTIGTTTNGGTWTLNVLGTLNVNNNILLQHRYNGSHSTSTLNVNGDIVFNSTSTLTSSATTTPDGGSSIFNLQSGSKLITANATGIFGSVTTSAFNFTRNLSTAANYEFNGTDQTTTGLPATVNNLTFSTSGNKTLSSDVIVSGTLLVQDAASFDIPTAKIVTANTVTNTAGTYGINILAGAGVASGSLAYTNGTVDASVQFYSKAFKGADYKYQFFGIPFTTMTPNGYLDGSFLFKYNEANTAMWEVVTENTTMIPIQGYAITQNAATTYQFTGTLYHAPITSYSLTYTTGNVETSEYKRGEHIIANPYTAAIPISSIAFSNMEQSVAFFNTGSKAEWTTNNPNAYSGLAGQYLNIPKANAGIGGLPADIPSLQGFLVKVNAPAPPLAPAYNKAPSALVNQGTVSIPVPTAKNAEPLRVKADGVDTVYTIIDINGEVFGDKVWLFTEPSCTKGFDNGYDATKIKGSVETPQFYAMEIDGNYQVNTVDDINNTLLGFVPGVDTEYTMTFTHYNSANAYPQGIYLKDLVKGITVDITASGSTYTFSTVANNANAAKVPVIDGARFKIVTAPDATTDVINSTLNSLYVFSTDNKIVVDNKRINNGIMKVYNTDGKMIVSKLFETGINTLNIDLPKGMYFVHASNNVETVKTTLIIK